MGSLQVGFLRGLTAPNLDTYILVLFDMDPSTNKIVSWIQMNDAISIRESCPVCLKEHNNALSIRAGFNAFASRACVPSVPL